MPLNGDIHTFIAMYSAIFRLRYSSTLTNLVGGICALAFLCANSVCGSEGNFGLGNTNTPYPVVEYAASANSSPYTPSYSDSTSPILAFQRPQPQYSSPSQPYTYSQRAPAASFTSGNPYLPSGAGYGNNYTSACGSCSDAIPISPGFPNYDRWTQQSNSPSYWQILPDGLIFPSYLAGLKEPRIGGVWNYERNYGWIWDATAGGRMPILRYGTKDSILPEGFQIDVEGAGMVRIDYENDLDLLAADFRAGLPITFGNKRTQYKLAYYHLSSHLGDEYMLRADARDRINYVRDAVVFAVSYRIQRDVRIYGEVAWAFFTGENTDPWEIQVGVEYSPIYPANRHYGSPFFAVHGHLLQELDFGGNINVQLGWQWRGPSNHLFRMGLQYFCGASEQFEFQDLYESKIGFGLWADF